MDGGGLSDAIHVDVKGYNEVVTFSRDKEGTRTNLNRICDLLNTKETAHNLSKDVDLKWFTKENLETLKRDFGYVLTCVCLCNA